MKKYLVICNPISHSLSPILPTYWLKNYNIDAFYEKRLIEEKDLKTLCDEVREGIIEGFNGTVPYKEKIKKHLDGFTLEASDTNAVNTVFRKWEGGNFIAMGDNTDVYGFQKSCSIQEGRALIIGAGGATRAVMKGLSKLKVKSFAIINRTKENVEKLLQEVILSNNPKTFIYEWCKDEGSMQKPDIIINCTSLGLKNEDRIPLDFSKYKKKFFNKKIIFYDLIYNPAETNFLKNAKNIGQQAINRNMMFIFQAQKSLNRWHKLLHKINQEVSYLLHD